MDLENKTPDGSLSDDAMQTLLRESVLLNLDFEEETDAEVGDADQGEAPPEEPNPLFSMEMPMDMLLEEESPEKKRPEFAERKTKVKRPSEKRASKRPRDKPPQKRRSALSRRPEKTPATAFGAKPLQQPKRDEMIPLRIKGQPLRPQARLTVNDDIRPDPISDTGGKLRADSDFKGSLAQKTAKKTKPDKAPSPKFAEKQWKNNRPFEINISLEGKHPVPTERPKRKALRQAEDFGGFAISMAPRRKKDADYDFMADDTKKKRDKTMRFDED